MWKKFNNQKGVRHLVEDPIPRGGYVEDDYNGPTVHRNLTPDLLRAPPRPSRNDVFMEAPRLPFGAPSLSPAPESEHLRPASSVYSQPSPSQPTNYFPRYNNHYDQTEEVSPPSSPEPGAVRSHRFEDHEVSPIDSTPDISRFFGRKPSNRPVSGNKSGSNPSSNIPILRREKKRNQIAAASQNNIARRQFGNGEKGRTAVDPRWDPYSGEITTSDGGKPQSVKPGQFAPPGLRPLDRTIPLGNEISITGPPKPNTSFGERVKKLKSYTAPVERPEWKGATGRVTLVAPVADQLDIPPMSIPRKSSKRVASPVSGSASPVSVIRSIDAETGPASAQDVPFNPTIPSISMNSGQDSPRGFITPTTIEPNNLLLDDLSRESSQERGASPITESYTHKKKDSVDTIERNFREAFKNISVHAETGPDPYVQPPSRFSVTTYAPSTSNSPRPSIDTFDQPPVPIVPQQPSSILDRKRPQIVEGSAPKETKRKAVNTSPILISMTSTVASRRTSNIAKNLPQSPPEVQSLDLISALEAQLDNLAHRRNNITKSIRQMTELMPKDNVTAPPDVKRKREMEKTKVEGLRVEEADIRRQEHDIGLKLHRAWKRKDKNAAYEPTGLWVRRVTG